MAEVVLQAAAVGGERRGQGWNVAVVSRRRCWSVSGSTSLGRCSCSRGQARKVVLERWGGRHNNSLKPTTLSRPLLRSVSFLVRISLRIVPLRQPCGGLARGR